MSEDSRSSVKKLGVNVLVLFGTWALTLLLVRVAGTVADGSAVRTFGMFLGVGAGLFAALRFRAQVGAWILAAFAGFLLAEGAAHLAFGSRAVQGGEVHLTVMAAALAGSLLTAFFARALERTESKPPQEVARAGVGGPQP